MARQILNPFESTHLIDDVEQMRELASVAKDLEETDEVFHACGTFTYIVSFEDEPDVSGVTLELDLPHGLCTAAVDLGCVLSDQNMPEIYLLAKHYQGFIYSNISFWAESEAGEMDWKPGSKLYVGYSIEMGSENPVGVCKHVSSVAQRVIRSFKRVALGEESAMDCIRGELNAFKARGAFAR